MNVTDETSNSQQEMKEIANESQTVSRTETTSPSPLKNSSSETDAVDHLTYGVVNSFLPDLMKTKKLLTDITENQQILIETIQQENVKFLECEALAEVRETMDRAKLYHMKLVNIKKEMLSLYDRTACLKKRALRLQQQKQSEALREEQRREREFEKEKALTARDVSKKKHS